MMPRSVKIENGCLSIVWNDDERGAVKLSNLRYNCPCAICAEDKERKGKGYIPLYNDNEIGVAAISQIGNYAIAVSWKDGHNTGIYNFDFLSTLTGKESKAV